MTIDEVSKCYGIPVEILEEYCEMGLCGALKSVMGDRRYDDQDLENLSMIMTLHDIGFTLEEVEIYMKLVLRGDSTADERMRMLNTKRDNTLDEIHFCEKKLERMDYLRHRLRSMNQKLTP